MTAQWHFALKIRCKRSIQKPFAETESDYPIGKRYFIYEGCSTSGETRGITRVLLEIIDYFKNMKVSSLSAQFTYATHFVISSGPDPQYPLTEGHSALPLYASFQ